MCFEKRLQPPVVFLERVGKMGNPFTYLSETNWNRIRISYWSTYQISFNSKSTKIQSPSPEKKHIQKLYIKLYISELEAIRSLYELNLNIKPTDETSTSHYTCRSNYLNNPSPKLSDKVHSKNLFQGNGWFPTQAIVVSLITVISFEHQIQSPKQIRRKNFKEILLS